jgi:hypothetical protein
MDSGLHQITDQAVMICLADHVAKLGDRGLIRRIGKTKPPLALV